MVLLKSQKSLRCVKKKKSDDESCLNFLVCFLRKRFNLRYKVPNNDFIRYNISFKRLFIIIFYSKAKKINTVLIKTNEKRIVIIIYRLILHKVRREKLTHVTSNLFLTFRSVVILWPPKGVRSKCLPRLMGNPNWVFVLDKY